MFQSTTAVRRGSLVLATVLLGAGPLVAGPAVVAGSASHSVKRWAGYEIPRTGGAAGGWIGGYEIGDTPIFLITPTREPNRQGYQRARVVDDLSGRRGATRAETKRAAWILSKYGGYRDATQAAAVDASVYAVLVGGRWSTTGVRGARRIHEAPEWATVLRFARIMLKQSRLHAGQYRARLKATNADAGGTIEATVKVTDGHGRPAAGLPVTVDAAGAAAVEAVTGDNWQGGDAVRGLSARVAPHHRHRARGPRATPPSEAAGPAGSGGRCRGRRPEEARRQHASSRTRFTGAGSAGQPWHHSGGFGGTGHRFGHRRRHSALGRWDSLRTLRLGLGGAVCGSSGRNRDEGGQRRRRLRLAGPDPRRPRLLRLARGGRWHSHGAACRGVWGGHRGQGGGHGHGDRPEPGDAARQRGGPGEPVRVAPASGGRRHAQRAGSLRHPAGADGRKLLGADRHLGGPEDER